MMGKQLYQKNSDLIKFIRGNFGNMDALLYANGIQKVHGILLDVGVSSMQVDIAERGFSFMQDGPLDMRMGNQTRTAADLVNNASESELARIIFEYGGERKSRIIAKAIVKERKNKPINSTLKLADIIASAVRVYKDRINPRYT